MSAAPQAARDEVLDAYVASARRSIAIVRSIDDVRGDLVVPACPDWTVRQLLSHLAGTANHAVQGLPWDSDPQVTVDQHVASRSGRALAEIADEWESVLPALVEKFSGLRPTPLVVDSVTHEHDLRSALGGAFVDHDAGLADGLLALTTWVGAAGLVADPGITLRTPTSEVTFGGPTVGCEVDLPDDWELFRLLGVRRSAAQLEAYPHSGDRSLLFAVTNRYPLPEQPLETDG